MSFNDLYESHNFHVWHNYFPQEKHYANLEPHSLYALQKVDDVYYSFAHARYNAYMTENDDFGQLVSVNNEHSLLMVKSNFLINALNFYNFAIDLSWQVLFFYTSDNSLYFLCKEGAYDKYSGLCNYDRVLKMLEYRKEYSLIYKLKSFRDNDLVQRLRKLYNYLKHRGTIHFQGLGEQYDKPYMTVNIEGKDITYNMFVKHEVAIEDLYGELLEFDQLFFAYFQSLLEEIVPSKYFLISDNLLDVL